MKIDTSKTLDEIHRAFAIAKAMPNGTGRELLYALGNSAMSATMLYIRHPTPDVQKKHYDAVDALKKHLGTMDALDGIDFGDDSA